MTDRVPSWYVDGEVEPELTLAWLVQALGIVREVSTHNETYNPHTLAALHWGERAVQRIAELEAEVAQLRAERPTT